MFFSNYRGLNRKSPENLIFNSLHDNGEEDSNDKGRSIRKAPYV